MVSPDFLTRKQLAEMLQVRPLTISRAVAAGRLPRPVFVSARSPRWRKDEVLAALARTADLPPAQQPPSPCR